MIGTQVAQKTSQADETAGEERRNGPATRDRGGIMVGLGKLTGSEFRLLFRDPGIAFLIVLPLALGLILGLIPSPKSPSEEFGGGRFIDYWVPTIITMIIAMMGLNLLAAVLGTYRERGVLRRFGVTPIRPL